MEENLLELNNWEYIKGYGLIKTITLNIDKIDFDTFFFSMCEETNSLSYAVAESIENSPRMKDEKPKATIYYLAPK